MRHPLIGLTALALALTSAGAISVAQQPRPPVMSAYQPARLVVEFRPDSTPAERRRIHAGIGARVDHSLAWRPVDVVTLPGVMSVGEATAGYLRQPGVVGAQPNWRYGATNAPNDPSFTAEWGLHNTGQRVSGTGQAATSDVDIDAPEGWSAAYGAGRFPTSGGAVVGVIDTGVDLGHPDLAGKVVACATAISGSGLVTEGQCSDDGDHGTHIAGTVAAGTGNREGVAGVAPDASLAVFKALDASGFGWDADIVAGIRWLRTVAGARVINMSFGDSARSDVLEDELADAAAAGVLLVASAGNSGDDARSYPAYHPDVISVGAVGPDGRRSPFSVCNSDVEIAAPGLHIISTAAGGGYARASGTSMASAHVAGALAVLVSRRGFDAATSRAALVDGAGARAGCGRSRLLNLAGAMRAKARRPQSSPSPSPSGEPTPDPLVPTVAPLPPALLSASPSAAGR